MFKKGKFCLQVCPFKKEETGRANALLLCKLWLNVQIDMANSRMSPGSNLGEVRSEEKDYRLPYPVMTSTDLDQENRNLPKSQYRVPTKQELK